MTIWTFLHIVLLAVGIRYRIIEPEYYSDVVYRIYPFYAGASLTYYDFTDFLLYVGPPILIFWFYRYNMTKDK